MPSNSWQHDKWARIFYIQILLDQVQSLIEINLASNMKQILKSKILTIIQAVLLTGLISLSIIPALVERHQPEAVTKTKISYPIFEVTPKPKMDNRAKILKAYLAKYNSPLEYSANDFIEAADKNQLDWKLVPSIAGVESTFGKHIPGGFNGWGWGVYGDQAIYFSSWREAIFTISEGLKTRYVDRGLTDPYSMNRVYAASPAWGGHVVYFMNDLDRYAQNYHVLANAEMPRINVDDYIAGQSAMLNIGVKIALAR